MNMQLPIEFFVVWYLGTIKVYMILPQTGKI